MTHIQFIVSCAIALTYGFAWPLALAIALTATLFLVAFDSDRPARWLAAASAVGIPTFAVGCGIPWGSAVAHFAVVLACMMGIMWVYRIANAD